MSEKTINLDKEPPQLLDLSDKHSKLTLMQDIGKMQGWHEVSIKPRKANRSNKQNSYWWVGIVKPFCEYLREEWGDKTITMEQAHVELKLAVLGAKEIVNKQTGESKLLVPTSHNLTMDEFWMLIEKASLWLAENCGIQVIPAEVYLGTTV